MRLNIQETHNLLSQSMATGKLGVGADIADYANYTAAVAGGGSAVSELVAKGAKETTGRLSHLIANIVSLGHTQSLSYKLATDPMAVQIFATLAIDIVGASLIYIIIFYYLRGWFFPTQEADSENEGQMDHDIREQRALTSSQELKNITDIKLDASEREQLQNEIMSKRQVKR